MDAPKTIYEDNQGVIELAIMPNSITEQRSLTLSSFSSLRVVSYAIRVIYCPTKEIIAVIVTKGFTYLTYFTYLKN